MPGLWGPVPAHWEPGHPVPPRHSPRWWSLWAQQTSCGQYLCRPPCVPVNMALTGQLRLSSRGRGWGSEPHVGFMLLRPGRWLCRSAVRLRPRPLLFRSRKGFTVGAGASRGKAGGAGLQRHCSLRPEPGARAERASGCPGGRCPSRRHWLPIGAGVRLSIRAGARPALGRGTGSSRHVVCARHSPSPLASIW